MGFPNLNLPLVEFKTKLVRGDMQVFDPVRKKYFLLTSDSHSMLLKYCKLKTF